MMRPNLHCLVALSIAIGAATWLQLAFAEDSGFHASQGFHPPQTEPERALDKIFRLDDADPNMFYFALGIPWYNPAKDTGYVHLFTEAVLRAWREKEAAMVKQTCRGEYREGELCGMDFDPIVCGQDRPDVFMYRTVKSGEESAIIITNGLSSMGIDEYSHYYRLIRKEGVWKLDGVYCRKDDHFNMSLPL